MRDTKLQTGGQCIYKMSYSFMWLGRSRESKWVSSGFPTLHLVGWEQGVKVVVLWVPTPPLIKVTFQSSTSGSLFPIGFPQGSLVGPWGCVYFPENYVPAEVLHKLP